MSFPYKNVALIQYATVAFTRQTVLEWARKPKIMNPSFKRAFPFLAAAYLATLGAGPGQCSPSTAIQSGPHHTMWQSVAAITNGSHVRYTTNRYTELAT